MIKKFNARLMRSAGFEKDPYEMALGFPTSISYWINKKGVRVITDNKEKMSLKTLIDYVIIDTSYRVREELIRRLRVDSADCILKERL